MSGRGKILVLSGGVGGAKLALGLYDELGPDRLSVLVNTGDDFDHLGLRICPDLDTILYTLGGLDNPVQGWGRRDETWAFMKVLEDLGGETWFQLGDGDLALHVERTRRLGGGESLSAVIAAVAAAFGVRAAILPMSDAPCPTVVGTMEGELGFQDYFVRRRCVPAVTGLRFAGEGALPAPGLRAALTDPALEAIVIAPSNPHLSIDPILAIPGMKGLLQAAAAPVVAVTPIIRGQAVKGPTAKIMAELGLDPSPLTVASHYGGLIDGFVLDEQDASLRGRFSVPTAVVDTLMTDRDAKRRVARAALDLCAQLAAARR